MTRADVQAWLDRYIAAWRSNEAALIADLFTEGAVYAYRPFGAPESTFRGREAIVGSWLDDTDEPDAWEAQYEPYAVEGDRAVATGWSRYRAAGEEPERTFHNVYLLGFGLDGRCAEFHEYYMEEPSHPE